MECLVEGCVVEVLMVVRIFGLNLEGLGLVLGKVVGRKLVEFVLLWCWLWAERWTSLGQILAALRDLICRFLFLWAWVWAWLWVQLVLLCAGKIWLCSKKLEFDWLKFLWADRWAEGLFHVLG